ncbi:MAG: hypothetical protein K6T90_12070 [Leptolyngbyaceae cyanobacterium HOT.MB2.61]|jgi:protein-disulfide isomerase|nr:hypothetical protein [Leptolyngbyaceae cyanobacterium HOT.MB2.61]
MNHWLSQLYRSFSDSRFLLLAVFLAIAPLAAQPAQPAPASTPASKAQSNPSVTALARHLKAIGAKMYGAYWCPHCHHQKDMFGAVFNLYINYIECDPRGYKAQPALCKAARIEAYPTWEIKGKLYPGVQSLEELATLSGYQGIKNF